MKLERKKNDEKEGGEKRSRRERMAVERQRRRERSWSVKKKDGDKEGEER